MTIEDLERYVEERSEILDDENKSHRESALKHAWICVDNAMYNCWVDAAKAAYMAIKIERRYDNNSTTWKELPKVLYEYMSIRVWG